jgi:carboxymethylenebutenolidase
MLSETFTSGSNTYKITVYPARADGEKHPMVLLVHGNFGLVEPYGDQIQNFAKELAELGYLTAVPQYYDNDDPRPMDQDPDPHVPTLSAAIGKIAERADADPDRLGLIGFSLGATTVMTYIAAKPPGKVKALADFFGFLTPTIRSGVGHFPPTIIFHNKHDEIVLVGHSQELHRLLASTIPHEVFSQYDEKTEVGYHAFRPGADADLDSRQKAKDWFVTHLPPNRKKRA